MEGPQQERSMGSSQPFSANFWKEMSQKVFQELQEMLPSKHIWQIMQHGGF